MNDRNYYEAFSLVETIITMVIMSFLMLLVGYTFTTMLKTSITMDQKLTARDELDTGLELLKRTLKSAATDQIYIYDSSDTERVFQGGANYRVYTPNASDEVAQSVKDSFVDPGTGDFLRLGVGDDSGNEIHIVPAGSDRILCYGYFENADGDYGVLVKSSMSITEVDSPWNCFFSATEEYKKNTMILNSEDVNFTDFSVYYNDVGDNTVMVADLTAKPVKWIGDGEPTPYFSQIIVRTGKLDLN